MTSEPTQSAAAPVMDYRFPSGELQLSGHLAVPADGMRGAPGLVICHGFPTRGRESPQSGQSFPELADRIATELGWLVLTMNFRGCGQADGEFSLNGWLDDVHAGVAHLRSLGVAAVWVAGYGSGGSLALCEGARNPHVRGVAAMGAQADFDDWARNPRRLLLHARQVQVIKDPAFPPAFDRWASELKHVRPLDAAESLAPRRLLVIHGDRDDLTPPDDGRALAAAHGSAEFRLISGAGHELRHDPRAIAVFLGWLSRQRISSLSAAVPDDRTAPVPVVSIGNAAGTDSALGTDSVSPVPLSDSGAGSDAVVGTGVGELGSEDDSALDGFVGEPTIDLPLVQMMNDPSADGPSQKPDQSNASAGDESPDGG
ncbi:MAG TPA: alpha/beta fold hydrolase [Microthrixaceae bacterium]|nr:alpha/beta fold hydrolase [Microthrixaceae bacterium]